MKSLVGKEASTVHRPFALPDLPSRTPSSRLFDPANQVTACEPNVTVLDRLITRFSKCEEFNKFHERLRKLEHAVKGGKEAMDKGSVKSSRLQGSEREAEAVNVWL